jgi:hypothetical protein
MRKHHVLNAVQATISRQARCYSTDTKPFNAAVIGGGITGMTAAWRLCQDPKCTKVTLYEKSPRLGGWLQSEKVEVEGGHVVYEYGPRTVRASKDTSMPIVDLVRNNIYFFFSLSLLFLYPYFSLFYWLTCTFLAL